MLHMHGEDSDIKTKTMQVDGSDYYTACQGGSSPVRKTVTSQGGSSPVRKTVTKCASCNLGTTRQRRPWTHIADVRVFG